MPLLPGSLLYQAEVALFVYVKYIAFIYSFLFSGSGFAMLSDVLSIISISLLAAFITGILLSGRFCVAGAGIPVPEIRLLYSVFLLVQVSIMEFKLVCALVQQ